MSMTSTNFTVGLRDDRNSSRVLKPPGGGHTDIFGAVEEKVEPQRSKIHQQSSITTMFHSEEEKKVEQNGTKEESKGERVSGSDENVKPAVEENKTTNKRGRVPPGGWSSGLW